MIQLKTQKMKEKETSEWILQKLNNKNKFLILYFQFMSLSFSFFFRSCGLRGLFIWLLYLYDDGEINHKYNGYWFILMWLWGTIHFADPSWRKVHCIKLHHGMLVVVLIKWPPKWREITTGNNSKLRASWSPW